MKNPVDEDLLRRATQARNPSYGMPTTSDIYVHVLESVRKGTVDRMDRVLRRITGAA